MTQPRLNLIHQSFKDCLYHSLLHFCRYRPCINLRGPVRSEDTEDRGPDFHDDGENPDQMRRMDDHRTSWWWSALFTGLIKSSSCAYMCFISYRNFLGCYSSVSNICTNSKPLLRLCSWVKKVFMTLFVCFTGDPEYL